MLDQSCHLCKSISGLVLLPTCGHILCKNCFNSMLDSKLFTCPFDRVTIGNTQEFCEDHKGILAEFYCIDCGTSVCHWCLLEDAGSHRGHKHRTRENFMEETTSQLRNFVRDASIQTKQMLDEITTKEALVLDLVSKFKDAVELMYCCAIEPDTGTVWQKIYTSKFQQQATQVFQEGNKFLKNIQMLGASIEQLLQNLSMGVQFLKQIPMHSALVFSSIPQPKVQSSIPKTSHNIPSLMPQKELAIPPYILKVTPTPNCEVHSNNSASAEPLASLINELSSRSISSVKYDAKAIKAKYESRRRKTWVLLGSEDVTQGALKYNSTEWKVLQNELNPKRTGFAAVPFPHQPNHVVVLGGHIDGKLSRSAQVFDIAQDQFIAATGDLVSPIFAPTSHFGTTVMDDKIYYAGGKAQSDVLRETYVHGENGWVKLPKMSHKRSHHSLVNLSGQLYAVGGFTNTELDSVESYDPRTNKWQLLPPMPRPVQYPSTIATENYIYVCGGKAKNDPVCEVSRLDIRNNTWENLAPMNINKCGSSIAVMQRDLVIIGGLNSEKVVERYNVEHNTWTLDFDELPGNGISFSQIVQLQL